VVLEGDIMRKMFYQIIQYGRLRCTHHDIECKTEEELKEVCNRVVERAKKAVVDGDLLDGDFKVQICDEKGKELDSFLSSTDYTY
jgi:hypothetical protein